MQNLEGGLFNFARITREGGWFRNSVGKSVEAQINALGVESTADDDAASRLLRTFSSIPKEPTYDSDKKNLELIRPQLDRVAEIAMKNPMLHRKLAKAAVGRSSYHGHELLNEVFKNVKEKAIPIVKYKIKMDIISAKL